MRKLLLLSLLAIGTSQMKADDYLYLTFTNTDGAEQSVSIDGLKVSFADGNIVAEATEETLTLPLADVAKMYFSDTKSEQTGIKEAVSKGEGISVYTTSGMFIGIFANAAQAHKQLEHGLYVIRNNGKTYKMAVK